jgi:DNA polymerase-3 subunit delta
MVAVKAWEADRYLAAPPDGIRLFLLFGSDAGAVTERAQLVERVALQRGGGEATRFGSDIIVGDPGRISDEANAGSLFGGEPVIRLRVLDGRHAVVNAVQPLLDRPPTASWVIVEAGELPPASALRKAFEASPHAAAVPSYPPEGDGLAALIRSAASDAGILVEPAALDLLSAQLGGDRLAVRGELEKLFLYVGEAGLATIADVEAIVGDTTAARADLVIDSALLGDHEAVDAGLQALAAEGGSAQGLAAQALRHLIQLSTLRAAVDSGVTPVAAVERSRPPVFIKRRRSVEAALRAWPARELAVARRRVDAAIAASRIRPALEDAAISQALQVIAQAARRLRRV